jgi:hypothetical protein
MIKLNWFDSAWCHGDAIIQFDSIQPGVGVEAGRDHPIGSVAPIAITLSQPDSFFFLGGGGRTFVELELLM